MKKTILKVLGWIAYATGSIAIGYVFGSIAGWILNKLVDVEFAERHPYITIMLWSLAIVVAIGAGMLVVTYPLQWLFDWYMTKVDDIEDDPFEG